jgi:hypothetical protein
MYLSNHLSPSVTRDFCDYLQLVTFCDYLQLVTFCVYLQLCGCLQLSVIVSTLFLSRSHSLTPLTPLTPLTRSHSHSANFAAVKPLVIN